MNFLCYTLDAFPVKAAARFGEFSLFQYAVKRYRIISAIAECKGWADFFWFV